MIRQISIKTKFGWISAFEQNNKIFKVKFGKCKNKSNQLKKAKSFFKKTVDIQNNFAVAFFGLLIVMQN